MTPAEYRAFMAQRTFYHFTDVRNLDSIRAHDGLLSVKGLQRLQIIVAAPGGNSWSRQADASAGVDDFVHLCFCDEHPMEYEARRRGDIGATQFLRIKPEVLEIPGVCVTLEVSNKSGAKQVSLDDACKSARL